MIKLADAFKVEVYELIKPVNVPPCAVTDILTKYTKEVNAIFAKAIETTEKNTVKSLSALHDKYISAPLRPEFFEK